jgi:hypothetical protein
MLKTFIPVDNILYSEKSPSLFLSQTLFNRALKSRNPEGSQSSGKQSITSNLNYILTSPLAASLHGILNPLMSEFLRHLSQITRSKEIQLFSFESHLLLTGKLRGIESSQKLKI